jgi:hypothetical protein
MDAKGLIRTVVPALAVAAVIALLEPAAPAAPSSQDKKDEFYARSVVDKVEVVSPEEALGEPDGRFAEIRPGGELTVRMESRIYYSESSDDGSVVTKGGASYGLAGLFRMDEEGEDAWQPLHPGRGPGGFKFGPAMFPVAQSTDTIRIVNDDTKSVHVDAVVGYRRDSGGRG